MYEIGYTTTFMEIDLHNVIPIIQKQLTVHCGVRTRPQIKPNKRTEIPIMRGSANKLKQIISNKSVNN